MPADPIRNVHFSSGFTRLNEPGKTHIEKIISQLSDLPPAQQDLSPSNPEEASICKPSEDKLQLGVEHEQ